MAVYNYQTEPLTDFSNPVNVKQYETGLNTVRGYLGKTYPVIIGGKAITTNEQIVSKNPANHDEIIGYVYQASVQEAELAMQVAYKTFASWKKVHPSTRADVLLKAAGIMRKRKFELSALLTLEAGKPWPEADADTAEAIDFLEYYARQMLELTRIDDKVLSRRNIERNQYNYIPLGVGAVISPWNFPLAILAGMTCAALVSGNTVVLKPAITTQVIAHVFYDIMCEAGIEPGVINLIPGSGTEVGEYIVSHPLTRFVSFTGSKKVGVTIYEKAAKVQPGQKWLKRVIAEMGGKDAIIVDASANIELAAQSIVQSAFGFSGQKCSACSRAIIHEAVYDEVVQLIEEKTRRLTVGDPSHKDTFVGPLNDALAFEKVANYIEIGRKEGRLLVGGNKDNTKGYFIEPTVFVDVSPSARIMQEEIFGPVLAVTKVSSFEEALTVANDTEYGLTGAVISKTQAHLDLAKEEFHVGNLYLNRKCTGAIVGYQPFGGFNMSGTDSKAGGPDYLLLHMQGKTISEQF